MMRKMTFLKMGQPQTKEYDFLSSYQAKIVQFEMF